MEWLLSEVLIQWIVLDAKMSLSLSECSLPLPH